MDFKFSRVYHQDNIDKILVNVQDITQQITRLEQKLEHERAQNDLQIEMLTTILDVSPKSIHEHSINKDNIMKINDICGADAPTRTAWQTQWYVPHHAQPKRRLISA